MKRYLLAFVAVFLSWINLSDDGNMCMPLERVSNQLDEHFFQDTFLIQCRKYSVKRLFVSALRIIFRQ
jgi:hypothetical protein